MRAPSPGRFCPTRSLKPKFLRCWNALHWPQTIQRNRNGEKVYELVADSLEINKSLPGSTFELPAGMKRLKHE